MGIMGKRFGRWEAIRFTIAQRGLCVGKGSQTRYRKIDAEPKTYKM